MKSGPQDPKQPRAYKSIYADLHRQARSAHSARSAGDQPPQPSGIPNLGEWLESRSLKQKDLAAILGVDNATISRIENGLRDPTPEMLENLTAFFGVSIDELRFGRPSPSVTKDRFSALWIIKTIPDESVQQVLTYLKKATKRT